MHILPQLVGEVPEGRWGPFVLYFYFFNMPKL